MNENRPCGFCHGTGSIECTNCGGAGYVELPDGTKQLCQRRESCEVCGGTGLVPA